MENVNFPKEEKSQKELNGNTVISFELDRVSDISIEIYDLKGSKCATVSGKNMAAGERQITINTFDLRIAPGSYVYHLQVTNDTGSATECRTLNII